MSTERSKVSGSQLRARGSARRHVVFAIVGGLAVVVSTCGYCAKAANGDAKAQIKRLHYPPLKFQPRKAQRLELDNGIKLFLLEDHDLPLLEVAAQLRTGSYYEPANKAGLSGVTATVIRQGGTQGRTPEQINEDLELLAAGVEFAGDREHHSGHVSCLKKDTDRVLAIFANFLMRPAFDEQQFNLAKERMLEGIRRRNDEPGSIVGREFRTALYGSHHPYGWRPELATVQSITRDDLIAFHRHYYKPNNCWLAVAGDFDSKEMIEKLRRLFADWKRGEVVFPSVPVVQVKFEKATYLAVKDITQTNIMFGHFGVKRHNPDEIALTVMNEILGGSDISRIWRDVRSRRGLAYSVGTFFNQPIDTGGFAVRLETKAESTIEAINAVLEQIRKMRGAPPTDDELKAAQESIVNAYVFRFQNAGQIATQQMALEFDGYPKDYLETYVAKINAVTKQEVLRVAQKYLHPDAMTMMVVGDPKKFDKPLTTVGPVGEVKLEP